MPTATTSEIDDIFGSSSGSKNAQKGAVAKVAGAKEDVSTSSTSSKPKKKKKSKSKASEEVTDVAVASETQAKADNKKNSKDPSSKKPKALKETTSQSTPKSSNKTSSNPSESTSSSKKRPAPETVIDPSLRIEVAAATHNKKRRVDGSQAQGVAGGNVGVANEGRRYVHKDDSDDERFRDSRGTGPRRKTEEGFSIYKEDELGITDAGGDTPLCPFDCDCCF
ncbi:DUF1764-domain-containing protein [Clavulina sp. PMI_390]|nr:DUF1764-domain-containing protein [Clavulina sp. PMI_390]